MPFSANPIQGELIVVNGISYQYDLALNAWFRYGSTTANAIVVDTANITSANSSVSTTTGALIVAGGAGIAGNVVAGAVYTNSYFYANGTPYLNTGYTGSAGTGFTGSAGSTGFTGSAGSSGSGGTDANARITGYSLIFGG